MRSSAFVYNSALIWRWLAFAVTAIVLFIGALTFLWWSLFSGIRYDNIALAILIASLCFCLPAALAAVAPAGRNVWPGLPWWNHSALKTVCSLKLSSKNAIELPKGMRRRLTRSTQAERLGRRNSTSHGKSTLD